MDSILHLIGIDAAQRKRRLQFVEFDQSDADRLAAIVPFVESIADEMVDRFYQRILSFPEAREFLTDPVLVARLKLAQRQHFLELFTGPYDEAYFESRLRVGLTHARIQLPAHLYLAGYLVQINFFIDKISREFGENAIAMIGSFSRVIMLDIALATDAYIYGGFVERSAADSRAYEAVLAQEALEVKMREEQKREELLRMVVHDIRSPVAAMMATARAAMRRYRDPVEPPGKQFALVEATGQSVLQIIDNMVSHARAPGGELPLNAEPFDVGEVVSACVAQLRPFAQQTGHVMNVGDLDSVPVTRLDLVLVRRVVSNLLMNACRHTPAGSSVDIRCRLEGAWCRIIVSDDGPGVPAPVREAFHNNHELHPRSDVGAYMDSGLGLPFSRMACERMGGSLELLATTRSGSCFVVLLPA